MTNIGSRIATERKLAGLSQAQLAQKAAYSIHMVRAVEQGRELASPGFVAAVSRALHIEPEQLTLAPYHQEIEQDGGPLEGLPELRVLLAEGMDVEPLEPVSAIEASAELSAIDAAHRSDKGRVALNRLYVLIRQLHGSLDAAHTDGERGRVLAMLAHSYMAAGKACHRLQFLTLAAQAYDRMDWAAAHADDPVYAAIAKSLRARVLMQYNATDTALRLVDRDLSSDIGGALQESAVRGHAHLCGAIVAARGRRLDVARDHIDQARELCRFIKPNGDLYGLMFSAANVETHSVSVELEAGDPGKAAREGTALHFPADMPASRAGYHWQDVARAWVMIGEPGKALASLNTARRIAPQLTRTRPTVRETLRAIAAAERRRTASLTSFARWAGVSL